MTGANPNDVPPAFRGRQPAKPSYIGMTDEQVLQVAANALRMVQMLPLGSSTRAAQWTNFHQAMAELGSRAISQALERMREIHEQLSADGPPAGDLP